MPEYLEFVIYKDGTMVGGMIERNCACSAEAANKRIPETAHREQVVPILVNYANCYGP